MCSKSFIFIFIILFLGGCATPINSNQTKITFTSSPPGAVITTDNLTSENGKLIVIWNLNATTSTSNPVTATWISGAKTSTRMKLDAGKEGIYIFERPANIPGVDADIRWAIHLQQQKEVEKKEFLDALGGFVEGATSKGKSNPPPTINTPIKCTSIKSGVVISTTCY